MRPNQRQQDRWRRPIRWGLVLLAIDLVAYALIVSGVFDGLFSFGFQAGLRRTWATMHWLAHQIMEPYVIPAVFNHAGSAKAVFAIAAYGLACGLQAFGVGFLAGLADRLFRRQTE